jgi:4-hydroxy-2-oxoheptanedioate aldolase
MKKSHIKDKMIMGNVCLGTWVFLPSPDVVEIIGLAGLDFVVIDMEHSPITYENASSMIVAAESKGIAPYVRISELSASHILRTLDTGAHGIQIPHVETADDAKSILQYSKYYPLGERGMAPSTRAGKYTLKTDKELLKAANDETLIVLTLESERSLDNVSEIIEIEGVDVIYIGPYDLSQAMGLPGQVDHIDVLKKMERIFSFINESGKIAGSFANTAKRAKRLKDLGVNYLTCETDGTLLRSAFSDLKNYIKNE